jgi:S-DNA-T family DNA segregation ATPase FtsK/SpoIIIE
MGEVSVGPTVTQFTLKPHDGIKLARIVGLNNDLALALAAHPIRIEAPIPGKSLVGIEVPNQAVAIVNLREILEANEFRSSHATLRIALGKDVAGKPWLADLAKMPHMLVAGSTGSGKTVCLNSIIVSLLYSYGPDELRFIMVDPKRVELTAYNNIPHLLVPAITDVAKTLNAMKWAIGEMDRRFTQLARYGKRDIGSYNETADEKMPYLVIVIDELADLMVSSASNEVETCIIRLAQMARAVGIHLILATQRPSVDVITGLIKANFNARIAFAVASGTDSRTILDSLGAEKLVGRGDMLFTSAELSKPKRLQGTYISDLEIKKVTDFIKSNFDAPEYQHEIVDRLGNTSNGVTFNDDGGNDEPLLNDAQEIITRAGKASASFLQRRMQIGYARAARILDLLEEKGVIGPGNGAKPREILVAHSKDPELAAEEGLDGAEESDEVI